MLAATEAMERGYGGVTLVSHACGLSRVTITKGIGELSMPALSEERIRRPGGGRRSLTLQDPKLPELLERFVEPLTRGDPESPLRWACKGTRALARELTKRKHPLSHEKVAQLLRAMHYSLQSNRKTEEGEDHPDRDAQFKHINKRVRLALKGNLPEVSDFLDGSQSLGETVESGEVEAPVLRGGQQGLRLFSVNLPRMALTG
jgi:hypothetical protein